MFYAISMLTGLRSIYATAKSDSVLNID